jgi:hypothetical protein
MVGANHFLGLQGAHVGAQLVLVRAFGVCLGPESLRLCARVLEVCGEGG